MNMRPAEDELHAYVDGQLDPARREQVERWLDGHPEQAERVSGWQDLNLSLREAFEPVLAETPPDKLQRAARFPPRRNFWRAAAAIGWLVLGGIVGYGVHGWRTTQFPAAPPALAHSAAIAHAVYVPEVRHPVEVGADQEAHLAQWLSKRLATPLRVPHLAAAGYTLVGGRLLPGEQGPVAQFMYEDSAGKRLTLYVRTDAADNRETAFRFAQEGRIGVFYWLDGKLGYALSGELPREKLLAVADAAYRQLSPP